jgi:hypothetical protein
MPVHTEPGDAQHQYRERGDIDQCVDHGSTTTHCPFADVSLIGRGQEKFPARSSNTDSGK